MIFDLISAGCLGPTPIPSNQDLTPSFTHAIEFDFGSNWAEAILMSIPYRFDYSTNKLINHLTTSLYWNL
jgi:hypothetical protein